MSLAALALLALAAAPGPTALEEAGRRLYEEGRRPDGSAILAHLGADPSPLPATALPCAGCHGRDGAGRPEGGVVPPAITWQVLTAPRGHVHGQRSHPAFDARALAMAVEEGVDPAGHRLDAAMPAYSLSRTDLEALVAWLVRLDHRRDPGLDDTTIRLGTVLPATGPARPAGLAMRAVLEAALDEVNEAGGVNGRRLTLVAVEGSEGPGGAAAAVRALTAQEVFALVSGFLPGQEGALAAAAAEAGLPLVGLHTPPRAGGEEPLVFSLLPGAREQARVLVDFAAHDLRLAGRPAVVLRQAGQEDEAAAALAQARERGWAGWPEVALHAGGPDRAMVDRLAADRVEVVLHLGGDASLAALLAEAGAAGWSPVVLVPGALAGRAAAAGRPGFGGRLFIAFPTGPSDETEAGLRRLERLAGAGGTTRYRTLQASAACAVTVLVEGLRRAGRTLGREGLVRSLEEVRGLETGLSPAMSFGPGRRLGALGGYVVAAGPAAGALRPVGGWRGLE